MQNKIKYKVLLWNKANYSSQILLIKNKSVKKKLLKLLKTKRK